MSKVDTCPVFLQIGELINQNLLFLYLKNKVLFSVTSNVANNSTVPTRKHCFKKVIFPTELHSFFSVLNERKVLLTDNTILAHL